MVDFKKILGSLVEFNEESPKPKSPNSQDSISPKEKNPKPENQIFQESPDLKRESLSPLPEHVNEIQKRLQKVLEEENKKNFPGADYYEFILALENMKDVPVESARYLSAFKVLSATQGLTREHLLKTAEAYINIIDRELGEFNLGFDKEIKAQVEDQEKLIDSKNLQMQEFAKQISSLNEEVKKLNQDLVENKTRLNSAKNSFLSAAQSQKEKIKTELNKIQNYIP